MTSVWLTERERMLLGAAGVDVVTADPRHRDRLGAPRATVATTQRDGVPTLLALNVAYGRQDTPPVVELQVFSPSALRAAAGLAGGDGGGTGTYLAHETVRKVAVRSLEIPAVGAHAVPAPLGGMVLARQSAIGAPHATALHLDGHAHAARAVTWGDHAGYWCELPADAPGLVLYAWGLSTPPRLVTASR
jgi:hypothetical protein